MAVNVGTLEILLRLNDEMTPGMQKALGKLKDAAAAFGVLAGAAVIANKALQAQAEQEAAINKLNLALANQGRLTTATSQALQDYSSKLQDNSTFADEVVLASEAMLATFGMNEKQIMATTSAAADFAAATGTDLATAATLLGKAFAGNTAALSRYGIVIDENLPKSQRFSAVIDQLNQRFGGSAQAATQTYTGQLAVLENQFGEVQEALGKFLGEVAGGGAPFSVLIAAAKALSDFLGRDLVQALGEARALFLLTIKGWIDSVIKLSTLAAKIPGAKLLGLTPPPEAIAQARAWSDALGDAAEQISNEAAAAAAAAGHTMAFKNGLAAAGQAASLTKEQIKEMADIIHDLAKAHREAILDSNKEYTAVALLVSAKEFQVQLEEQLAAIQANARAAAGPNDRSRIMEEITARKEAITDAKAHAVAIQASLAAMLKSGKITKQMYEDLGGIAKESLDWKTTLQGIALLAGALGGKFGDVLQVVSNIGEAFKDWDKKGNLERFGIIAGAVGQIGGVIGGKAGGAIQGAAGGAMTGASLGKLLGPGGAIAGGILGGIAGLLGGLFSKKSAEQKAAEALGLKSAQELAQKQQELVKSFGDMLAQMKEARKELAGVGASGVNKVLDFLSKNAGIFNTKLAKGAVSSADATNATSAMAHAADYVVAAFSMLRASGLSTVEALAKLKPALDALAAKGALKGTAAAPLAQMANFAAANAGLLGFIEGLGQMANALAGFGQLTQDLATKISRDMGAAIDAMIAKGLSYSQALALSAQDLYNLMMAAQRSGTTLDAHTQKMIDDAKALGLFKDMEDPMKRLVDIQNAMLVAMAELVKLFGGKVPESVQKMIDEFNAARAKAAAGSAGAGAGGGQQQGQGQQGPPPGSPGGPPSGIPRFAGGTQGWMNFGLGTTTRLHGIEAVVRPGDQAPPGLRGSDSYDNRSSITINVSGADAFHADKLAALIGQAVKDNKAGLRTTIARAGEGKI